jgi:carbon storage regulator
MLILSRKKGDGVVIDNKIVVTIAERPRNRVKLEVACPVEYPIQWEGSGARIKPRDSPPGFIITLKKLESFVINSSISVTVVDIVDDKVRLGIVLPKECPIHRKEVLDAIFGK